MLRTAEGHESLLDAFGNVRKWEFVPLVQRFWESACEIHVMLMEVAQFVIVL